MDTTRLRTLTLKSTMKFGKYHDLTVSNIIDCYGTKATDYLVWVYYNSSQISFMPNILDILCILPENEINKPGKVSDKFTFLKLRSKQWTERSRKFEQLDKKSKNKLLGKEQKLSKLRKQQSDFEKYKNEGVALSKKNNAHRNRGKSTLKFKGNQNSER